MSVYEEIEIEGNAIEFTVFKKIGDLNLRENTKLEDGNYVLQLFDNCASIELILSNVYEKDGSLFVKDIKQYLDESQDMGEEYKVELMETDQQCAYIKVWDNEEDFNNDEEVQQFLKQFYNAFTIEVIKETFNPMTAEDYGWRGIDFGEGREENKVSFKVFMEGREIASVEDAVIELLPYKEQWDFTQSDYSDIKEKMVCDEKILEELGMEDQELYKKLYELLIVHMVKKCQDNKIGYWN